MRCPKCRYVFSEELRICPRCKEDMVSIFEKIGSFPIPSKEPFLLIEDFLETKINSQIETPSKETQREIEMRFSSSEET
ncbi:MAG: hypothetical protein N3A56_01855 [Thermodesulfobacteriaceae bacterium]|nr:hypothetical protein [Caldimicrobium sp.]MCX8041221.1 hypothetical protein [Thermodesulfobacteriaceae bacterium]MDW8136651.1 hypothetical protein [Thermodesulfobacterium sp.]